MKQYIRLNLQRFTSWKARWDATPKPRAEAMFYQALAAQGDDAEDSEGEPTILVKDNSLVRQVTRQRMVKRVREPSSDAGGRILGEMPNNGRNWGFGGDDMDDDDDGAGPSTRQPRAAQVEWGPFVSENSFPEYEV